jgi:N6-adenosine-specific RNA methylase IME4
MEWPFGKLEPKAYGFLMVDPPWTFATYSAKGRGRSADAHYKCQSMADIELLPVSALAAPDCLLWLWATHPMLPQQIAVGARWGFRFSTSGVWRKVTKRGKVAFGTGFRLRSASEPFLLFTRGNPRTARTERTVFDGLVREHSRKPDEAYAMAERMMPGARRADVFSRERRQGWEAFGDELAKFNEVAA